MVHFSIVLYYMFIFIETKIGKIVFLTHGLLDGQQDPSPPWLEMDGYQQEQRWEFNSYAFLKDGGGGNQFF